jgi:hypothetical protein
MRCEAFEARLDDVLDRRLPPEEDAELAAHAAACDDCRHLLAAHARLLECVAQRVRPQPSPGFVEGVVSLARPGRWRAAPANAAVAVAAVAAILVVGLLPVASWWMARRGASPAVADGDGAGGPRRRPMATALAGKGPSHSREHVAADSAATDDHRPPPVGETVVEGPTGQPRESLASIPYEHVPGPAAAPPAGVEPLPADGRWRVPLASPAGESASGPSPGAWSLRELMAAVSAGGMRDDEPSAVERMFLERVAAELEPLTDSVTGAMGVLLESLPGGTPAPAEPPAVESSGLAAELPVA